MPEQEQALPHHVELTDFNQLDRWLSIQPIFDEVYREREAQLAQWGNKSLPLGFGGHANRVASDQLRKECDEADKHGELTHRHILLEEFYEALAESDPAKARDELIQVGACVIKAIQQIDRDQAAGGA